MLSVSLHKTFPSFLKILLPNMVYPRSDLQMGLHHLITTPQLFIIDMGGGGGGEADIRNEGPPNYISPEAS